jgi:hypothetical protein
VSRWGSCRERRLCGVSLRGVDRFDKDIGMFWDVVDVQFTVSTCKLASDIAFFYERSNADHEKCHCDEIGKEK